MSSSHGLTDAQLRAMLDILTHYETYREIEKFKTAEAISQYGYPFTHGSKPGFRSSLPIAQLLLNILYIPAPPMRLLPENWFTVKMAGLVQRLGEINLSESYDKASLGTRKTLATATAAVAEAAARGMLGGFNTEASSASRWEDYDEHRTLATDLVASWNFCIRDAIYGDLVDRLFFYARQSQDFDRFSHEVGDSIEYIIMHLASFFHHIFVECPEGQYLINMIENINRLYPWTMVTQTLRLSNVATMINAMLKIFLGKNRMFGDGNLMQKMISMALNFDAGDYKKVAEKIKKTKPRPNEKHLAAIDEHVSASRDIQETVRQNSMLDHESVIVTIIRAKDESMVASLTDEQTAKLQEYYAARLAVRDREKLTAALCHVSPDHLTAILKDCTMSGEPTIRAVHASVPLHKYIGLVQKFVEDFIQTSKPKKKTQAPPAVEDYIMLLRKHKGSFFKFLHEVSNSCPSVHLEFREFVKDCLRAFQRTPGSEAQGVAGGAGSLTRDFQIMYARLPPHTRCAVVSSLDMHAAYLDALEKQSMGRMQSVLDRLQGICEPTPEQNSAAGPGIYLAKWASLLDNTLITPATPQGPLRHGRDVKNKKKLAGSGDIDDAGPGHFRPQDEMLPPQPDVAVVVDCFGVVFRDLVSTVSSGSGAPAEEFAYIGKEDGRPKKLWNRQQEVHPLSLTDF